MHDPLIEHLSATLGIKVELVIPKDYVQLIELAASGEVHLMHFGGLTYLRARANAGVIPLVLRDVDLVFTSVFITARDGVHDLAGCRGQSLLFGSRLSTSGHLMPRRFLERRGIQPEAFFSKVEFSGNHEATALAVRDGRVCVGAANAQLVKTMYQDGSLSPPAVRVIWETPPYPDYVWAISRSIPPSQRDAIREAFLQLDPDNPSHRAILRAHGAGSYMPARHGEFAELERAARAARLLE